ncbi:hypothetical protein BD410DRAFT_839606 [Rickenella mellea]|uniref:Uncharacterized protein n=1 Tax=Rickenella mellea TaxID=50990 RepID=A0A4Y7Q554_9AGAM|nr:hypothetical protein BD410DRAFT_839606 [Rickenella mellea]
MAAMNANIATTNAATGNFRIISRNSRILVPNPLAPLQKSTPGDGRNLAQPLLTAGVHLPPAAAAANVGAFPPAFNGDPTSYTHQEIINLIVFYNDAFGIVVGDVLTTRRNKLREWMSVL